MNNKTICILITILLLMICLVGCKDCEDVYGDTSSISSQSSVPIVIVDDEKESEQPTQSEIDKITEDWENNPNVSIEVGKSNSSDNSSNNTTSNKQQSDNSSMNESSEEYDSTDSSNNDSSDISSDKQDDGYFDVAV